VELQCGGGNRQWVSNDTKVTGALTSLTQAQLCYWLNELGILPSSATAMANDGVKLIGVAMFRSLGSLIYLAQAWHGSAVLTLT